MRNGLIASAGVVLIGTACSTAPPEDASASSAPVSAARQSSPPAMQNARPEPVAETDAQRLGRMIKPLMERSVHFAFDSFAIANGQQALVQAHVGVLRTVGAAVVILEGHADERGSREYNLALGQKRAEAVARALKLDGIDPSRIETVGFGEEKPRSTCHEERCWADNRRVDFRYRLRH